MTNDEALPIPASALFRSSTPPALHISQAIARLKAVWSFVAAGIALAVAPLKDWLYGSK